MRVLRAPCFRQMVLGANPIPEGKTYGDTTFPLGLLPTPPRVATARRQEPLHRRTHTRARTHTSLTYCLQLLPAGLNMLLRLPPIVKVLERGGNTVEWPAHLLSHRHRAHNPLCGIGISNSNMGHWCCQEIQERTHTHTRKSRHVAWQRS